MKRLVVLFTLFFSFLCVRAADITAISNAFKSGNASSLTTSMDAEVDVAVPGSTKKCNAAEAVVMLNAFFQSNASSGFTVLHNADKKENGFIVGKLPAPAKEYRVNIMYRTEGGKAIIQSIRIE